MIKRNSSLFLIMLLGTISYGAKMEDIPLNLYKELTTQTDTVITLRTQTTIQLKQISELNSEIERLKKQGKDDKFIIDTVDVLTKGATLSKWANPDHIRYVRDICKKYEYIVAEDKKVEPLACWQTMMMFCMASGLNPRFERQNKDEKKSWDKTIADINECCFESTRKELPKHLQNADLFNIERAIASRYVHIKQFRRERKPFVDLVQFWQWNYYSKIKDN